MSSFMRLFIAALSTAAVAHASVTPARRDVYKITYPNSETVWNVGETHNVTWYAPYGGTGYLFITSDTTNLGSPLLSDINADAESVTITVPALATGGSYYVVMDFDSTVVASAPFGIGESATVSGTPHQISTVWWPSATATTTATSAATATVAAAAKSTTSSTNGALSCSTRTVHLLGGALSAAVAAMVVLF
ncbi:hypothetical protein FISHEDRAFT_72181 [Fistulina hepatica ATCC 64428]|uniref:Ser-Thr-rich glycosyl-phosphatidyl-inositol-anchored membrane family-domain-containing protein n=1 Tax=Fistulina hepatica ATCC 64428 TaxID=1128425 RepID=A0A0D7AGI2_9AGAR|nr:hypothetical protein FISHEDRAFT_72181 [Fistulina hepatica ATCC 64428]